MGVRFRADIKISTKKFFSVVLLTSSFLAWFLLLNTYFSDIFSSLGIQGFWSNVDFLLFYGFGAISALLGSTISESIQRRILLASWILSGMIALVLTWFFSGIAFSIILSVLLGFSVGFGFPSIAAFLSDSTVSEERGRISGLIVLMTFILIFSGVGVVSFFGSGVLGIILFCFVLRSVGLFSLVLDKCERKVGKDTSWKAVSKNKNLTLYLLPWILFNVAAGLLVVSNISTQPEIASARALGISISYVCMAFSGVVAGALADRFGRKQPIIIALIIIGISFALLGYAQIAWTIIVYYTVYGIAWGFLFALYLTVLGDLSASFSKEKFYALGIMMPLMIFLCASSVPTFLGLGNIPTGFFAPLLSAIIFLSIVPILRANETLPASKINARKLKEHIDKVGKLIEESKE